MLLMHRKLWLVCGLLIWAGFAINPAAHAAAASTNTLTFSETLSDKVLCTGNRADGWDCTLLSRDGLTISTKISLSGVTITNFDQNTSFDLSVGNFSVSHSLGDDPKYVPGKTSAIFVDTETNDSGKTVVYQIVRLKWTAKQLTVTITGKTSDTATSNLFPILADSYDGSASGPINSTTTGSIDFGDASVTFGWVAVTGNVVTKDVTGKDGSSFSPSTIKIKGKPSPLPPSAPLLAKTIGAGGLHSLAVASNGTAWAWGRNWAGQLGDGTTSDSSFAVQVAGLTDVVAIAGGVDHSLALAGDTSVWSWGVWYILGIGGRTGVNAPTPMLSLRSGIIAIAAGSWHSLALAGDGTVLAWGDNENGQLGNGTTGLHHITPVQVVGLSNIVAIAGGQSHSLAVAGDGTAWAWGDNSYGQLGDGTTNNSSIPVPVVGLSNLVAIAGGAYNTFALANDGTVWAWGGLLGNGTTNYSSIPVQVVGLSNIVAIAGGVTHSLALANDGTVWAWGGNAFGQLGNGTTTTSLIPVQVVGLSNIVAIAEGVSHSLALANDDTVWAWGLNRYGQLGNGTLQNANLPVQVRVLSP